MIYPCIVLNVISLKYSFSSRFIIIIIIGTGTSDSDLGWFGLSHHA